MSREQHSRPADARLEEAETLIWSLLDEQLGEAEVERLSGMIEEDPAVRSLYIECVQLHVDLREHFGQQAADPDKSKGTVVLQNLAQGVPGLAGLPPITK